MADQGRGERSTVDRRPRILVGSDGSAGSRDAIGLAAAFARTFDAGLEVVALRAGRFSAARALVDLADAQRADLIVIGSGHGAVPGQAAPDALGEGLVPAAPCPIAIAPRGFGEAGRLGLGVVGVAYEGAQRSRPALDWARRHRTELGAKLRIVATMNPSSSGRLDAARAALAPGRSDESLAAGTAGDRPEVEIVFEHSESAAPAAMRVAELDLLVLGAMRRGPVRRSPFSAVSARLHRTAPCPVVIVRGGVAEQVDDWNHSAVSVAGRGAPVGVLAG
jgi:nucleotide-binding universal stress UspA family protein